MSGDDLSTQAECDGIGIGFQVKYYEKYGFQLIRLICSYTDGPEDELKFVETRFRRLENVTTRVEEDAGEWQERLD